MTVQLLLNDHVSSAFSTDR